MTENANPKSGCFTTVVRRLLCAGSQQTHPSDNIPDAEPFELHYEEEPKKDPKPENDDVPLQPSSSAITPNVVAKLMGLGAAPETNRVRYDECPGSVTRSKSVNFMDYILRIDEEEEEEEDEKDGQRRRRVRASVSFREILPSSARSKSNNQKRHDFLLLYLDKLDENREIGSRSRRFEKILEDPEPKGKSDHKEVQVAVTGKKENKNVSKKFKDEPRKAVKKSEKRSDVRAKKVRWFLSPSKSKDNASLAGEPKTPDNGEISGDVNGTKRVAGKESDAAESGSDKSNSSPVSVLDRDLYDYLILDDDYYSGDSETTPELKTETRSSPNKTKANNNNNNNDDEETEFITKLMNMLSDLSEEDMNSSTWVSTPTDHFDYDQVEDFCDGFGQEILDLIMDQLVDDLCI